MLRKGVIHNHVVFAVSQYLNFWPQRQNSHHGTSNIRPQKVGYLTAERMAEQLEITILGGLYSITEANLEKLLSHLKKKETEGKTKRQILKLARNAIEIGVQDLEENQLQALDYLKVIQSFIFETLPPLEEETEQETAKQEDGDSVDAGQKRAKQISDLKLKLKELMGSQKNDDFDDKSSQGSTKTNASNSLLRREFKISQEA